LAKPAAEGTRGVTLLISGLDAILVAGALLVVLVAGTTLSWWLDSGMTTDWVSSFRLAADIWFAGHGVPLNFAATELGTLEIPSFIFSALPLGAALLIFSLGWRGGMRLYGSAELWPGWIGATLVYGGFSAALLALSATKELSPDPVAAYFFPAMLYLSGVVSGSLFGSLPQSAIKLTPAMERVAGRAWLEGLSAKVHWILRSLGSPALRAGTGFVFAMQAIASVVLAILVAVNWLNVIQLYEQLQGGVFGGFGSTLLQLAFLPNLTFFVSTWLAGPGFAIGTASSVSPLGTALGPIPTVPIFGTIPAGDSAIGMIILILPALIALLVTVGIKKHTGEARHNFATPLSSSIAMGLSIGFVAAAEMALLALLTQLSIGPGRMQDIGADPLWVFVWIFLEVAPVAFAASFYAARPSAPAEIPAHLKR
jgi:hypothetical protein